MVSRNGGNPTTHTRKTGCFLHPALSFSLRLRSDVHHVLLVPASHLRRLAATFQTCLLSSSRPLFLCSCRYYIARKAALSRAFVLYPPICAQRGMRCFRLVFGVRCVLREAAGRVGVLQVPVMLGIAMSPGLKSAGGAADFMVSSP